VDAVLNDFELSLNAPMLSRQFYGSLRWLSVLMLWF